MNKHNNIDPYDEEMWEEEDEDEIDENSSFLKIEDLELEIDTIRNFNHNVVRGIYGEVILVNGGENIIIFKNSIDKEKFLKCLGYDNIGFVRYKKNIIIEMIDKNIYLYGVFLKSFSIGNNNVNIHYDYFEIINK